MKFVTIGRHEWTDKQKQLLEAAGLTEEVARIAQLQGIEHLVSVIDEHQPDAIVIQALPLHLIAQILQYIKLPVYNFKIEAVATKKLDEECPSEADIEIVDRRSGTKRCSKTVAIQRLKKVVVEAEEVARVARIE